MLKHKVHKSHKLLDRPDRRLLLVGRGGNLHEHIAREALTLTELDRPINVLIVPSAANNASAYKKYVQETDKIFSSLGARVTILHDDPTAKNFKDPTLENITKMIDSADVIWMCGGNTSQARKILKRTGIAKAIINSRGKVIAGGSAGALEQAGDDAVSFFTPEGHPEQNKWVIEKVMGMFKPILGVHNNFIENLPWNGSLLDKPRSYYLEQILTYLFAQPDSPDFAVGIDDQSALSIKNGKFRVVNAEDAGAHVGVTTYRLSKKGLVESHFTPASTKGFISLKRLRPTGKTTHKTAIPLQKSGRQIFVFNN